MRAISGWLLLWVIVVGCSKEHESGSTSARSRRQQAPPVSVEATAVETEEEKEKQEVRAQAVELLASRSFEKLDEYAQKLRESKACYPDGFSKLNEVYCGIQPEKKKPDSFWEAHLAKLQDWVRARPESITARVALADTLVSYAWKARGGDYADKVSEAGWRLFGERLNRAMKVLVQAKSLKEKCPRWWSVRLIAGMGLGEEKAQHMRVFQEAVRAEPGYIAYYCLMGHYLLPRWYGEPSDLKNFLEKAANELGGEEGDLAYARVACFIQGIEDNVFNDRKLSWERADRGFQVMEKRFPDSLFARNVRAYLGVLGCNDREVKKSLVHNLEGKIDVIAWGSLEEFHRLCDGLYR